ncbi:MAG: S-layer homology domain-containing protein [Clostridia bacterium]|nr:S-layer homology domain-containing protein [Clostridia bacterium]
MLRKSISCMVVLCMIFSFTNVFAFSDADVTVNISNTVKDSVNSKLMINGNCNIGAEAPVGLIVKKDGNIIDADMTKSVKGGDFSFALDVSEYSNGSYTAAVSCREAEESFEFTVPFSERVAPIGAVLLNRELLTEETGALDENFNLIRIKLSNAEILSGSIPSDCVEFYNLPKEFSYSLYGENKNTLIISFSGNTGEKFTEDVPVQIKIKSNIITGGAANTDSAVIDGVKIYSFDYSKKVNLNSNTIVFNMSNKTQVNTSTSSKELQILTRKAAVDRLLTKDLHYTHSALPSGLKLQVSASKEDNKINLNLSGTSSSSITSDVIIKDFVIKSICVDGASSDSEPVTITIRAANQSQDGGNGGGSGGYNGGTNSYTQKPAADNTGSQNSFVPEVSEKDKKRFEDVTSHWAESHINKLLDKNIIGGYSDGKFYPDRNVTRAEFVKMVVRILNLSVAEYDGSFKDVKAEDWYAGYIQAALDSNLISHDEVFRPNSPISRDEMVKIAMGAYELKNEKPQIIIRITSFTDYTTVQDWAVNYIEEALSLGFVNGYHDGSFKPKGNTTRAEAAAVLSKICDLL